MGKYKHILFAADLIPNDDHAVAEQACEIARETGAKLTILHVIEQQAYNYSTPFITADLLEWESQLEEKAREDLAALGEKLNVPKERQILLSGQAKGLILDTADSLEVDLIVVGSHGRHGLDLLLLGSTATGVLHGANCDVLAVRVQDDDSDLEEVSEKKNAELAEA